MKPFAIAFAALLSPHFVLPGSAWAATPREIPGKFSIVPPEGWVWHDPRQMMEKGRKIARGLGVDLGQKAPVAYFAATVPYEGITSNLNIREVGKALKINDANLANYRQTLARGIGPFKLKIEKVEPSLVGKRQVMRAEWTYSIRGIPLKAVQVMYPGQGATFISTYTLHATGWAREQDQVEASINSFQLRQPWYAWFVANKWLSMAIAGGLVIGILALLARRRSA